MRYPILALMMCAASLNATLGEPYLATRTSKTENFTHFSVHERTDADDLKIREYTDANGMVFAVTWSGRRHPDLTQILGSHYSVFHMHANKKGRTRAPMVVEAGNFKLLVGGHQRDFRGQALLVDKVPTGVSLEVLK